MPIRPEERDRYPAKVQLSQPLQSFLDEEELGAVRLLRDCFGVDVARTYQFWEAAVARITTGRVTAHKCPWDIELDYFGEVIRVEVKFSQEFVCRFRSGIRPVFKFAVPRGGHTEKACHVSVFLGIDSEDEVHSWAVPSCVIPQSASITLDSPRTPAAGPSRSPVNAYRCPPTQLLPETIRAWRYHLNYDKHHHQRTRKSRRAMGDLFA